MNNIMLDLETMGTHSGAAIVSIGGVKFGASGLGEEFYKVIDLASSMKAGLTLDASTVIWWMKQSEAARKSLTTNKTVSLFNALQEFTKFVGAKKQAKIWGNGASFDNVLLGNAYDAVNLERPWEYWNDRCYRTMKAMLGNGIEYVKPTIAHDALEDAKAQAVHLCKIMTVIQNG